MAKDLVLQLRYLGVIPQAERREYRFQVEDKDKNLRLVVVTIENSAFRNRQLMFQEGPDLCYQKLLAALGSESQEAPIRSNMPVTESDIAFYRESHPPAGSRKPARRRPE